MLIRKSFDDVTQTPIKAEAPDLAAIRKYALREVAEGEVWTGSMKLCHDRVDRTHERFTKAYLERFAETLPGKSLMGGHDYGSLPLGRFYSASVVPDAEGHHLKASYYLPSSSPLVSQIELGVLRDVSIGFNSGKRVCDLCEKAWDFTHEHFPGQEYDGRSCTLTYCESEAHRAEAMEGSFVWLGAQPGAEAIAMAMKGGPWTASSDQIGLTIESQRARTIDLASWQPVRGDTGMTIEQATAEIERLKALPLAADREAELAGQIRELQTKGPLIADGEKYRTHLKAEIGRIAALLAKTATYNTIMEHLKDAGADSLQPVLDELMTEYDARFSGGVARLKSEGDQADKAGSLMSRLTGRGLL